jgi:hypothetical protein
MSASISELFPDFNWQDDLYLSPAESDDPPDPSNDDHLYPPPAPLVHPSPSLSADQSVLYLLEAVRTHLQAFAKQYGFSIVTERTAVNGKGEINRLWFRCKRGGKNDTVAKRGKRRSTGMIELVARPKMRGSMKKDCPWKGVAQASRRGDACSPWIIDVSTACIHNHPPSDPAVFPEH